MTFPHCWAALLHPDSGCISALLLVCLGDKLVISPWSCLFIDHLHHHHLFPPHLQSQWQPVLLFHPIPSCHPHRLTEPGPFHTASVLQVPLHFRNRPTFFWWKGDSLEVSEELEII